MPKRSQRSRPQLRAAEPGQRYLRHRVSLRGRLVYEGAVTPVLPGGFRAVAVEVTPKGRRDGGRPLVGLGLERGRAALRGFAAPLTEHAASEDDGTVELLADVVLRGAACRAESG